MNLRPALPVTILVSALLLAGCGASAPEPEAVAETTVAPVASAPVDDAAPAQAAVPGPADVTLADIDAYARAAAFKTAELQRSAEQLAQARSAQDQDRELELMTYMSSRELDSKSAEASGLDARRYKAVADALQTAADRLGSIELIDKMLADARAATEDTAQIAQAEQNFAGMRDQIGDPYAGFSAEVAEVLRARLPELLAQQREQAGMLMQAAR